MSFSNLKALFLAGFLGLTLIGCSSTPDMEDGDADATALSDGSTKTAYVDPMNADANAVDVDLAKRNADAKLASDEQAAMDANKKRAADLLANVQGQVVNFEFDRADVQPSFYQAVKLNADYLAANADATVTVKGFCDERGTREHNLALGERRAEAVKNALIAEGVSPSRISTISYGEESPVSTGHNEASWSQNRRVEFSY